MKKLFLLGLIMVISTCQSGLSVVDQETIRITTLEFQVKLKCRDDFRIEKDCSFSSTNLPTWLTIQNDILKAQRPPPRDSEFTITIVATDSDNQKVTRRLNIIVQYYATLEAQSEETDTNTDDEQEIVVRTGDYTYLQLLNRQKEAHELIISYLNLLEQEKSKNSQESLNIQTLKAQLQSLIEEEMNLMDQISESQGQLFQFEIQLLNLVDQLKQLQEDLGRQRIILFDQVQLVKNKQSLKSTLEKNLRDIESEISKREQQVFGLEIQLSGESGKCEQIQGEIDEANNDLKSLFLNKISQENNIAELQKQSNDYSIRIQELLGQVAILQSQKSKVDKRKREAQIALSSIEFRIADYQQQIEVWKKQCTLENINEIQLRITLLRSQIVSFQGDAENIRTQIAGVERDILRQRENLEIARRNLLNLESLFEEMKMRNDTLQRNIDILNKQIDSLTSRKALIQLEKNRLEVDISLAQRPTINMTLVRELQQKLKDMMVERIIIDSLINRILEIQDNVLVILGFRQLFESYAGLPENAAFQHVSDVQMVLKNALTISKVRLFSAFNLQDSCSKTSGFYNIGKIVQVGDNEVVVQTTEGDFIRVKILLCTYNLSSDENYSLEIGDTIAWKAYSEGDVHFAVETVVLSI